MQLLVAFWLSRPWDVEERLARIGGYFSEQCRVPLARHEARGPRVGVALWEAAEAPCRWPAWYEEADLAVATTYVPIGWTRVLGDVPPERAPVGLARALLEQPESMAQLNPPFSIGVLEGERLTLFNDGLGLGRLYEMEWEGGVVWSNRLFALPMFARTRPRMDARAWSFLAGCGWFMGDSTPIEGCRALGPGSVIRADQTVERSAVDAVARWVGPRPPEAGAVATAAEDLAELVSSVVRLWPEAPIVHLSGGRDSRVVAAAAIASGVDVTFQTVSTLREEAEVARRLLRAYPVEHRLVEERDVSVTGSLYERTLALHAAYDGVYAPAGIKQPLFKGFSPRRRVTLSGAGGEIVRGNYYRRANVDRFEAGGASASINELDRLYRLHGSVPEEVHQRVREQIERVIEAGTQLGVQGASLLDYFYLVERFRRWSNASAGLGSVPPLATPSLLRAGFDAPGTAKAEGRVQLGVIAELCPSWADVPFYKAPPGQRIPRPRLWETQDAQAVDEILAEPGLWDDCFDPDSVRRAWRELRSGKGLPRDEPLFQRLIWRALYPEHLARLSEYCA